MWGKKKRNYSSSSFTSVIGLLEPERDLLSDWSDLAGLLLFNLSSLLYLAGDLDADLSRDFERDLDADRDL